MEYSITKCLDDMVQSIILTNSAFRIAETDEHRFQLSMYILFQVYFILKEFTAKDIDTFSETIGNLGYEALTYVDKNLDKMEILEEREQTRAVIKIVRDCIKEEYVEHDLGKVSDKPFSLGDESTGSTTFP